MVEITKLIITNKFQLENKYGLLGSSIIIARLNDLIITDEVRAIKSKLVFVDEPQLLNVFENYINVSEANTEKENKIAINTLCQHYKPTYLLIIGAQDIVPFQNLINPVQFNKKQDPDVLVPSDLPYATNQAYSTSIAKFLNPSRSVGRIPGVFECSSPKSLLDAIDSSIKFETLDSSEYEDCFSVSSAVWSKSTKASLKEITGNDQTKLYPSPRKGPKWINGELNDKKLHLINCHGSRRTSYWQGEGMGTNPVAIEKGKIESLIEDGSIVAAECCYGAELHANEGICNVLLKKAIAFLGSTTTSFGHERTPAAADLIAQYFLTNIKLGLSTGLALLNARIDYISMTSLDRHRVSGESINTLKDLKTVAQFNLFGDPSLQPIPLPQNQNEEVGQLFLKSIGNRLFLEGTTLLDRIGVIEEETPISIPPDIMLEFDKIESEIGMFDIDRKSFLVSGNSTYLTNKSAFVGNEEEKIYMSVGKIKGPENFSNVIILEILKINDEIVSINRLHSK